ncbi:MAG: AraC family transcriptional regulator, partial [Verrucomicrobia bacterium]
MTRNQNDGTLAHTARRIVFVAAPETEILDLVGPLQVFARASDMYCRENPGALPVYSVEVVS